MVVCGYRAKNMQVVCPVVGRFSTKVLPIDFVGKHDPKIKGKFGKRVEKG